VICHFYKNLKGKIMAFWKKDDLTIDNMLITNGKARDLQNGDNVTAKNFICIEDKEINGQNIKEYIFKEILKYKNCNTLFEFQRTQFGFCGVVGFTESNGKELGYNH